MESNKYTTMKKYLYLLSHQYTLLGSILLFLFSTCSEDVLEENPKDFLAPQNAYNTIAGIKQGIIGLHISLRNTWYGGTPQAIIMTGSAGTDMAFYGEDPGSNTLLSDYQSGMTPDDPEIAFFWDESYKIIQMANVLIEGINNSAAAIWTS
jgi:hypothetical protein